jgi:hypothetical protein
MAKPQLPTEAIRQTGGDEKAKANETFGLKGNFEAPADAKSAISNINS